MKWLPIETAPKDGTSIIVMYSHYDTQIVHAAFWMQAGFGDELEETGWWTYDWSEVSRSRMDDHYTPTHWMPLPPPPTDEQE